METVQGGIPPYGVIETLVAKGCDVLNMEITSNVVMVNCVINCLS